MKKTLYCFLFVVTFLTLPVITNAETTTDDSIIIDIREETTTDDTIIITPPEENTTTDDTIIITPPVELDPIVLTRQLRESGKMSNEFVERIILDLTNIENGIIVSTYYSGVNETETIKTINVSGKKLSAAKDIITRFVFELTNRYRPDTNTDFVIWNDYNENIVHIFSTGDYRVNAIINVNDGLTEAFANKPIRVDNEDNDNSWVDRYNPILVHEEVKILTLEEIEELKNSLVEINNQVAEYISDNKYVQFFINTILSIF